jgi:hypothetical protein
VNERESDKERVRNLCKKAILLDDDRFNNLIAEISNSNDPVIANLCKFLERKRGAL